MKPNLCLFTDSLEPSGVGEHMLTLATKLLGHYHITFVCPPTHSGLRFLQRARSLGLTTVAVEARYNTPGVEELYNWLRAQRPDIFHCHAGIGWEGFGGVEAASFAGIPTIVRTEHLPYLLTHPTQCEDHRRCVLQVNRIICVGKGVHSSYIDAGVPPHKLCVIRNGITPRQTDADPAGIKKSLGLPETARVVLTVGRLVEQKGYEGLLTAVPDVVRREPSSFFVWVGKGPLEGDLRERVRDMRLDERVLIFPQRDDVPELMAASDLVVLPSLFEGLPLVMLEAMSAGLPVVGTRVCGTSEAISDGVTGRLVEPGDASALAAAVLEVLEQLELAARWGAAGRLRLEQEFTADRMGRETRALYESLLRDPQTLRLDAAHADLGSLLGTGSTVAQ